MKLPKAVRDRFRKYGRDGGRARARAMTSRAREIVARRAAVGRWTRQRFGEARFAALGLPGGELIDAGLADLAAGEETVESLLVSAAAPRLRREGVPVPLGDFPDPESRLYRLLERREGDLAHARYLAHLRQAASFADACHLARRSRSSRAS